MTVADSAFQADMQSVCVIRTAVVLSILINDLMWCWHTLQHHIRYEYEHNNNNPICKAPECQDFKCKISHPKNFFGKFCSNFIKYAS